MKHLAEVLDEATQPVSIASDLRALSSKTVGCSTPPAELRTYAYDASFLTQLAPRSPDAVVIAESTSDVSAVMRYAIAHDIPVTPRGAASGQAAGAVALEGGIVLALNAMNRILEIDVANMQAFCEPGVVHAQLNAALAPHGLVFPPDPGSSRMATVGGMASTNAHGMRAVKYGPTSAWVLGLEVVLPDGAGHRDGLGRLARQTVVGGPGVDQADRRRRRHARRRHAPAAEAHGHPAGARDRAGLVRRARTGRPGGAGGVRRRREPVGHRDPGRALHPGHQPVSPGHGTCRRSRRSSCSRSTATRRACAGTPSASPRSSARWRSRTEWSDEPARINALWEARSLVGAAVGMLRPGSNRAYCGEDICVPVARIPETLRAIQEISARHRIPIATYGHIGGGGLHPGHLIDGRDPDEIQRVLRVADDIHQLALRMGGTTTGEHGVGAARAPYMAQEHGPALEVMRRIKPALDPQRHHEPGRDLRSRPSCPSSCRCAGPSGSRLPRRSIRARRRMTVTEREFVPATESCSTSASGAVAFLTFNRPQARNALTWAMYEGLSACCDHVDADDRVKVLVLRGAGDKAFVAGTDISQFRAFSTPEDALTYERNNNTYASRLESRHQADDRDDPRRLHRRRRRVRPVLRPAAGHARTCASACRSPRTLGNTLSMQNFARLVSLIGPARTKDLIFTARLDRRRRGQGDRRLQRDRRVRTARSAHAGAGRAASPATRR